MLDLSTKVSSYIEKMFYFKLGLLEGSGTSRFLPLLATFCYYVK